VKDENTKTVALYARVSTLDQNCNLQFADLRRYASQRFNRAYEYVDEGVSGTQRRRPALDNLMKDAQRRMFDVVLVLKFDRFARSLKHLMDSLEDFGTLGIDFVSYTEGVDTTTPSGQLLFHIVGAVAQFERDLIAEPSACRPSPRSSHGQTHRSTTCQRRCTTGKNTARPWDVSARHRA
jgi:DNA invertase Pin-like site-specific DNA recombinase